MSEHETQTGHGDGHAHAHHPSQSHHWDTMRQQFEAGKLGMWLFLATEILFFGGLFCAYFIYRANHPELFEYGHHALNKEMGAINTVVLLVSSLTMALGVRAAQTGNTKQLKLMLLVTFLCGCGFMGIKYFEYSAKINHGYLLGSMFNYSKVKDHEREARDHAAENAHAAHAESVFGAPAVPVVVPAEKSVFVDAARQPSGLAPEVREMHAEDHGADSHGADSHGADSHSGDSGGHSEAGLLPVDGRPPNIHIFFSIYFMMTALHGIHVVIGMGLMLWLFFISGDNRFGPSYFTPVEVTGLYWHLVDLIWIFLFPLLYLI